MSVAKYIVFLFAHLELQGSVYVRVKQESINIKTHWRQLSHGEDAQLYNVLFPKVVL